MGYVYNLFGLHKVFRVSEEIVAFAAKLGSMPQMGMVVNEWSKYGEVRKVRYKQNNIFYHIKEERLIIIIVWDTRQNPQRLKQTILRYFISLT